MENEKQIKPKMNSLGVLIKDVIGEIKLKEDFYWQSLKKYLPYFVILYLLLFFVTITQEGVLLIILIGLLCLGSIAMIYINNILTIQFIKIAHYGQTPDLVQIQKESRALFWKLLIVMIMTGVFTMLWGLLLIIPGIIMAVYYSLSSTVFICEGYEGTSALKRSKELIKGYWLPVLFRWLVIGIVVGVVWSIVSYIGLAILSGNNIAMGLFNFVLNVISMFLIIPAALVNYFIYKDLRDKKGESSLPKEGKGAVVAIVAILVMLIIPIIATVSIIGLNDARMRARDARRITDIKQIQTALELYYIDEGVYPSAIATDGTGSIVSPSTNITIMSVVPASPASNSENCTENYDYSVLEEGQNYELTYCLESTEYDEPGNYSIDKNDFDF